MRVLNGKKRNLSMDLARVIACFMVICMHVTAAWKYGEPSLFKWHVSEVYDSLCRSAVPLFFMMSGAFYKNRCIRKNIDKIFHYIFVLLGVSLIYSLNDAYINSLSGGDKPTQIFEAILNYKYHLWYIPAFVFVLSIAPIVVKVMDSDEDSKLTQYMLTLWLLLGLGSNTIITATEGFEQFALINRYSGFISSLSFLTGNYVGYFVLGRALFKTKLSADHKNVIYALGVLSTIALYVLTTLYSYQRGVGDNRWMNNLNIFVLLQSIALFVFFDNYNINEQFGGIATKFAPYTFGIYLVHVFILEWCYKINFFSENGIWKFDINPILNIPIRVVIIWLLSLLVVFICKQISGRIRLIK